MPELVIAAKCPGAHGFREHEDVSPSVPSRALAGAKPAVGMHHCSSLCRVSAVRPRKHGASGFTLTEVLLVVLIIGLLSAIAVPNLLRVLADARTKRAMADLRTIESEVALYNADHGRLPDALADLGMGRMLDPWGNPYQYLRIDGGSTHGKGKWRKDRFLVPLNSDYDLYSMGPDGKSQPPLTAKASRDDIVRPTTDRATVVLGGATGKRQSHERARGRHLCSGE